MNLSAYQHALLAYGVSVLLLWGYAVSLWLSMRRQNRVRKTD